MRYTPAALSAPKAPLSFASGLPARGIGRICRLVNVVVFCSTHLTPSKAENGAQPNRWMQTTAIADRYRYRNRLGRYGIVIIGEDFNVGVFSVDLDRVEGPTSGVVGGAVRGQCRQGFRDPLLAHGGVVALDGVFRDGDVRVWSWAGALLSVAAEEIGAFVAGAGDGVLDDQPSAVACLVAVSAVQGAFEVVVVYSSSLSGGGVGVEDGLDAVEQMRVDEAACADRGVLRRGR
ncbi:hypothetical protein [Amycolatopsis sp. H20-H5]|uniref:hypothetical protein n=1 Tax=Amycolatopsis sp. H20-H5 TaxID=3046309 RepID=UPI002DBC1300|nr:hypothetical protein [Amycolatopsis sp. H20-H5]MEC3979049.1 hypothetical protein [Amycolatopsis sp. H20-H5]